MFRDRQSFKQTIRCDVFRPPRNVPSEGETSLGPNANLFINRKPSGLLFTPVVPSQLIEEVDARLGGRRKHLSYFLYRRCSEVYTDINNTPFALRIRSRLCSFRCQRKEENTRADGVYVGFHGKFNSPISSICSLIVLSRNKSGFGSSCSSGSRVAILTEIESRGSSLIERGGGR